jgi:hypothetical protein
VPTSGQSGNRNEINGLPVDRSVAAGKGCSVLCGKVQISHTPENRCTDKSSAKSTHYENQPFNNFFVLLALSTRRLHGLG